MKSVYNVTPEDAGMKDAAFILEDAGITAQKINLGKFYTSPNVIYFYENDAAFRDACHTACIKFQNRDFGKVMKYPADVEHYNIIVDEGISNAEVFSKYQLPDKYTYPAYGTFITDRNICLSCYQGIYSVLYFERMR